ncbi:pantoate--beta-alanine ligase [Salininema proteolyticum]|uniref:Pantothenate synthetase n=1 Tax=Salininema proteolyticum TaxID=1607685 RepID=A0ABV8U2R5_9ACTN
MSIPIADTVARLRTARDAMHGTVAVVPTMGALHEGHAALIRAARAAADNVVVTVFVNPLQFRPGEDLDEYPRTLEADAALAESLGADLVFAPSEEELYPRGRENVVKVHPRPTGEILEGASRPGFFTGVLTVVAKLFHLVRPHYAAFGDKDYQQLAMVRSMVEDLDMDVEILSVALVRDADGIALSSRNAYLSAEERAAALAIPRAVEAAQASPDPLAAARAVLEAESGLEVDYATVLAPDFEAAPESGPARLLIAAHVGTTRLIDNAPVTIGESNDA